jgi:4-amino-4-deoxy-L-arabinose transferase-like glycosyltransferase
MPLIASKADTMKPHREENREPVQEKYAGHARFWCSFAGFIVLVLLVSAIVWCCKHPLPQHWDEADYLDVTGIDVLRLWSGKLLTVAGRIALKSFGRPPVYRVIALPILAIFGFHTIVARIVSLTCFTLSLWFIYLTGNRVAGKAAGALAVLIFALCPEVIAASMYFGTDASLYLATSALFYFVLTIWDRRNDSRTAWIGLGCAVGFGFLSKASFVVLALPLLGFWLVAGHFEWLGIRSLMLQKKAAVLAALIAGPWWLLNIKSTIQYTQYARGFVRNSLGPRSLGTFMLWLDTVVQCLFGHCIALFISLVIIVFTVTMLAGRRPPFSQYQRAAMIACACGCVPLVLVQLSGTNYLLRHITPAVISLAIAIGILAEQSGWMFSWTGAILSIVLFATQTALIVDPVISPNKQPAELVFANGVLPWQVMAQYDQWDWAPVLNISRDCGFSAPKIVYLGNGRSFDTPQIQFAWISKGLPPPDAVWLWRMEDGMIDWNKVMNAADQSDMVITAPGFVGETAIKEDIDNEHNVEFADRLAHDRQFAPPVTLDMGHFQPVKVQVFVRNVPGCSSQQAAKPGY